MSLGETILSGISGAARAVRRAVAEPPPPGAPPAGWALLFVEVSQEARPSEAAEEWVQRAVERAGYDAGAHNFGRVRCPEAGPHESHAGRCAPCGKVYLRKFGDDRAGLRRLFDLGAAATLGGDVGCCGVDESAKSDVERAVAAAYDRHHAEADLPNVGGYTSRAPKPPPPAPEVDDLAEDAHLPAEGEEVGAVVVEVEVLPADEADVRADRKASVACDTRADRVQDAAVQWAALLRMAPTLVSSPAGKKWTAFLRAWRAGPAASADVVDERVRDLNAARRRVLGGRR